MKNLISISDSAASRIKKIIADSKDDVLGVIVGIDKSGCSGYSYKLDYAKKNNVNNLEIVESKGVRVFIEPSATMLLVGSVMDYTMDKLSSRFIFINPNEKSACGCGESFNI